VAKENCARAELIVLAGFSQTCMIPDLHRGDSKYMSKIIRQPSQQVLNYFVMQTVPLCSDNIIDGHWEFYY